MHPHNGNVIVMIKNCVVKESVRLQNRTSRMLSMLKSATIIYDEKQDWREINPIVSIGGYL